MAVDMFLKFTPDVPGESKDEKHKNEIDILAWSWGVSNSGTAHMGGGHGAGKANFQDLSVTCYFDKATPSLLRSCATGAHFDEAKLVCRKAGGQPLEYIIFTLKNGLISSVSTGGSGGEDRLTINFSINFEKIHIDYVPQKDDGTGEAAIPFTYDIAANKP